MSTKAERTPEVFRARLRARSEARKTSPGQPAPERIAYRKAAALHWSFDPRFLRLPDEDPTAPPAGGAVLHLVPDCTARASRTGMSWQLREDVRGTALASLGSRDEAMRYLAPNLAGLAPNATATLAAALLRGEPPRLDHLDERTLGRLREAVSWLRRVPGGTGLVHEGDIDARLERCRLLGPLRALLAESFEGRVVELDRLREHIGLLPPETWSGLLGKTGRAAADLVGGRQEEEVLVVHGPGGIGKSTLIAKSLLDHIDHLEHLHDPVARELPFAYVDAERATVSLHEPLSLVAEMARQLAVQYPSHGDRLRGLSARARAGSRVHRELTEAVEDLRGVPTARTLGRDASSDHFANALADEGEAIRELGMVLAEAVHGTATPPYVVVLDSFEEAQYRASPALGRMWSMFFALRAAYPRTRVIVAGRAPVPHPAGPSSPLPTLELAELDRTAATDFLVARGVGPELASTITGRTGGNPLTLQLAARVAEANRAAGKSDSWILELPARRRRFLAAVDDMLIQGMLYDRLLQHITSPDVRALAHPGLVLRRITPDLIRGVLAPHCDVDVPDDERARALFEELAREYDLVERIAPDVLLHRPDVRRVMLKLLSRDKSSAVRAVEADAVAYYQRSDRPEDRAEELYHRLRLGGSLREVKARWMPEAGTALMGAESELPSRSARLLARLLKGLPPDASAGEDDKVDQVDWEQRRAAEVEDLVTQGYLERAKALLDERRPWTPCSPLHALAVEVDLRRGDLAAARATVTAALDTDELEQCGDVKLELLQLSAQVSSALGDLESADADLDLAESTASRLGRDLDALGVLLTRARLHERAAPHSPAEADAEQALIRRVESTDDAVLASRPALLRAIAGEVAARAPALLAHAVTLVGLPALTGPAAVELATAVARSLDRPGVRKVLADLAGEDPERWTPPGVESLAELIRAASSTGRLDEVAQRLLATNDETGALTRGIASVMAEGIGARHG
jgi:hypothetical protein